MRQHVWDPGDSSSARRSRGEGNSEAFARVFSRVALCVGRVKRPPGSDSLKHAPRPSPPFQLCGGRIASRHPGPCLLCGGQSVAGRSQVCGCGGCVASARAALFGASAMGARPADKTHGSHVSGRCRRGLAANTRTLSFGPAHAIDTPHRRQPTTATPQRQSQQLRSPPPDETARTLCNGRVEHGTPRPKTARYAPRISQPPVHSAVAE